jgi:hypothetical protein
MTFLEFLDAHFFGVGFVVVALGLGVLDSIDKRAGRRK